MTTGNAFTFCLAGLGMWLLPTLAPTWVASTGVDGSSARELWLQVMAVVNLAIGAAYLARIEIWDRARAWAARPAPVQPAWRPATIVELAPLPMRRPAPRAAMGLELPRSAQRELMRAGSAA